MCRETGNSTANCTQVCYKNHIKWLGNVACLDIDATVDLVESFGLHCDSPGLRGGEAEAAASALFWVPLSLSYVIATTLYSLLRESTAVMTAVDPKPKPLAQVAPSGSEWIMEWIHGIMHISSRSRRTSRPYPSSDRIFSVWGPTWPCGRLDFALQL